MSTSKKQARPLHLLQRPVARLTPPAARRSTSPNAGVVVAMRPLRGFGTEPRSY